MIKVRVVCVGKLKESYWRDAVEEYKKRLSRFCELEIRELPERKTLEEEGEDILRACRGRVVVLTPEGKELCSEDFSEEVGKSVDKGEELSLIIGSSCGLCDRVKRAGEKISFSRLTFPHQMMRVILLEQLYRAFMIRAGAEYHK